MVDDEVEDLERRRAGALVALPGTDHRPQTVGRDHLIRSERVGRPGRLPASRRADEHDETGIREPDLLCRVAQHAATL